MDVKPISQSPLSLPGLEKAISTGSETDRSSPFQDLMKQVVTTSNDLQIQADQAMDSFVAGEEQDIHQVMMAINKAELSFRFMMEVRNKMIEAYQEINRMSV